MAKPERIVEVVEDLTVAGSAAFRASTIAQRLSTAVRDVVPTLSEMVQSGDLRLRYDLLGPDGRTIRRYNARDEIPLDQEVQDDRYEEPFYVTPSDVWVLYVPTEPFRLRTLRARARESHGGGAAGDPPGIRRRLLPKTPWNFKSGTA